MQRQFAMAEVEECVLFIHASVGCACAGVLYMNARDGLSTGGAITAILFSCTEVAMCY